MKKKFNNGDIVYWCSRTGHKYTVGWGMVDEQFSDAVCVDYLYPKERRLINGIPINEFDSEHKYKKLPKGWDYKTCLFEITAEPKPEYVYKDKILTECDITNPEQIKQAYKQGCLVKQDAIFTGSIEEDITKQGYRIIKTYPRECLTSAHISISSAKLYFTYEEAKKEVDENIAELYRQANLSDYDWSVEQIDENLASWKYMYGIHEDKVKKYRDWLLNMDKVEDIETRIWGGNIQWKYWKKERWRNIEL